MSEIGFSYWVPPLPPPSHRQAKLFRRTHDGGNFSRRCFVIQLVSYLRREQFLIFPLSGPSITRRNEAAAQKATAGQIRLRVARSAKRPMKQQIAAGASCVPRRSVWWMNGVKMGHYVIKTRAGQYFSRFPFSVRFFAFFTRPAEGDDDGRSAVKEKYKTQ